MPVFAFIRCDWLKIELLKNTTCYMGCEVFHPPLVQKITMVIVSNQNDDTSCSNELGNHVLFLHREMLSWFDHY